MIVTATEFKTNFGKYLDLIYSEDIFITKNGKIIAQLTQPQQNKLLILSSLTGFAKTDTEPDIETIREERLSQK